MKQVKFPLNIRTIRGRGLCPLNPHWGLCPQTPAGGKYPPRPPMIIPTRETNPNPP